ncbi:PhzF family phenazine biosynthesis protein [Halomonas sp. M20]|uniref:PhzF family phenazine biosynthesis protein n=1 Tax=Halomonas sp. M20 TaxID=2763264 RepID=UPI001D0A7E0F|nr:PhzF family phenazine biosynthesis protein [Halomonas sp. M20]
MINKADYYLLDVFTDRAFSGNPLAVFPHAESMTTELMQAIANELNLSETVFVSEANEANRYPIRIFTPTMELPFAGHPTVGTAHLLMQLGWAKREQALILEAGVGPLEVHFDEELACFTTARPAKVSASTLNRSKAASLLGLEEHQVISEPVLGSCGLAFHLVELDSLEALAKATPAPTLWASGITPSGEDTLYLYVIETNSGQGGRLRSRMFSMEGSLREDPATGSAAAALAGTLAIRQPGNGAWRWIIDQGVEMGRPSRIIAKAERRDNAPMTISIAGQAVIVGQGTMQIR